MRHGKWSCGKCENLDFEVDEFRATGSFLAKIFDVQNKKFSTVTCSRCGFTEVYKANSSTIGSVFDFFTD